MSFLLLNALPPLCHLSKSDLSFSRSSSTSSIKTFQSSPLWLFSLNLCSIFLSKAIYGFLLRERKLGYLSTNWRSRHFGLSRAWIKNVFSQEKSLIQKATDPAVANFRVLYKYPGTWEGTFVHGVRCRKASPVNLLCVRNTPPCPML